MAKVILEVMAVRDSAVNAYARPIFVPTIAVGVRSFSDEVNRAAADNALHAHAADFELWHIAQWDEDSGVFILIDARCVCRAKDVKASS